MAKYLLPLSSIYYLLAHRLLLLMLIPGQQSRSISQTAAPEDMRR